MTNKDTLKLALARFISEIDQRAGCTSQAEDRPLYDKFLAGAAIIMAKVEQDEPIGSDICSMERLFGHTWFRDEEAYARIYTEWDCFKGLLRMSFKGMTVNERLVALGLLEEFDKAVALRDEPYLRGVLFKCLLDDAAVEAIIKQQLKRK